MLCEQSPVRRCIAELELVGDLLTDAPLLQVVAPRLSAFRIRQQLAIERGGELVELEHRDPLAAHPPQLGVLLDLRNLDVESVRELLGHLDEALALELHHEREHVALLLAAEAHEEALVGLDVERRCLLAVERAEALPVLPGLLELDVLP